MSSQIRQDHLGRVVLPLLLLVLASLAACGRSVALSDTFDSPDALAREVLVRLARKDQAALQSLALTHDEFETLVWPKLPASRPERNVPLSFVWGRLDQQSRLSLAGIVARHGGVSYVLQRVEFEGQTTDYGTFRVQRESVLVVRSPERGVERIKVFGSMLTTADGRSKVFSYVID